MTFEEYQTESRKTAIYPNKDNNFIYPTLGLAGEAGEVAEKIKKVLRDGGGTVSEEKKEEIAKELGDVLWYLATLSRALKISFEDVARKNIDKLQSRQQRNELHGSGDNR